MLDNDTYLDLLSTTKKTKKEARPTFQERAKNIPNPVATALPPLPLSHIGHICREIADILLKLELSFDQNNIEQS